MYGLLAFGAVGVTLVIAVLIGYVINKRTQWDVKWGRYRDTQMIITQETFDKISRQLELYREIDHPLVSALTPVIAEHYERIEKLNKPRPVR